jgi:hypothetical protein
MKFVQNRDIDYSDFLHHKTDLQSVQKVCEYALPKKV